MPRKSRIDAPGALHHIIARGIERSKIFRDNTDRNNFFGSVICSGTSLAELSRRLKLSLSGVSLSVKRGERIVQEKGYKLIDF